MCYRTKITALKVHSQRFLLAPVVSKQAMKFRLRTNMYFKLLHKKDAISRFCLRRQIVCSRTFYHRPQGTAWCDFKCLAFCLYANLLQNWMHESIINLFWPAALSCVLAHQHHRPQGKLITISTCPIESLVLVSALFNKEWTVPFGCSCACALHVASKRVRVVFLVFFFFFFKNQNSLF